MSDSSTLNRGLERTILGPDPRLRTRIAVRGTLGNGSTPSDALLANFQEWPEMVEAVLEAERLAHPKGVSSIRRALGLPADPYPKSGRALLKAYTCCGTTSEKLFFAASVWTILPVLSAQVVALARVKNTGELLAAMHEVAPEDNLQAQLGRLISEMDETPEAPFVLNRESNAFHKGFYVDDSLVMIFREYPGHYTLFSLTLGDGVEKISVWPVSGERWIEGVLQNRNPDHVEARSLDDCRTLVAGSICRLKGADASEEWALLGYLVEERLFPVAKNGVGFVVGDLQARTLLDDLARSLLDGDCATLGGLMQPGSMAAVLLELFGTQMIQWVLGLRHGVYRLDVGVETHSKNRAQALLVGRTRSGQVLTRTRIHLVGCGKKWEIQRLDVLGIGQGEELFGPIWDVLSGTHPIAIQRYGDLSMAEQELVAGMLDTGFRLDETAAAVALLRESEIVGHPGCLAAAVHLVFSRLQHDDPLEPLDWDDELSLLCDRYEGEINETADMVLRLERQLLTANTYRRYLVS